jgi:hypothetical protein
MKENDPKSTSIPVIIFVRENGKKPWPPRHGLTYQDLTLAIMRPTVIPGPTTWKKAPPTLVEHAHCPSLFLSPSPDMSHLINVTCSPCLIKGRAEVLSWRALTLFTSSSSREGLSCSSSTSRHPWLPHYRDLGPSFLSHPFVPATTNQRK